ncbi:MAG: 50S ribosomal protein L24 [Chloroflexi bacterium CFX6]|nr:50S ribosomal protein L24 [Chloroflexi bacterium CFX6]
MQRIIKGDTVEVISGDERGVRGEVNRVMPRKNRVVVHGINLVKKHQRRTGGVRTQTGIIEFEAPLHLSNVAPVCPKCDRWTRVGIDVLGDGRKVRACRRCGAHFE